MVYRQSQLELDAKIENAILPLDAVKVMMTILPSIDSAIMPDMTRGAAFVPKTSVKNKVAMSSSVFSL